MSQQTLTVAELSAELTKVKTDRSFVQLNNLFLGIEADEIPADRRHFNMLDILVGRTFGHDPIRNYWDSEIEQLAEDKGFWI